MSNEMPTLYSRRSFVTLASTAAAALMLPGLAGCATQQETEQASSDLQTAAPAPSSEPQQRDLMGSPDACPVRVGLIMGPPSMGLSQFMIAAEEGRPFNNFNFTVNGVDHVGLSAAFNQGDYDICTLPSNIGPILFNNTELKNRYQIISVNNLGVLYVITTDASVNTMDDLAGRTVYSYGEGGTPEYTIEALLKKTGMQDSFNLEFKPSPFEILNLLQKEKNCVAILPQPFVSLSKTMVEGLRVPVDITEEWNRAFADTGSQAVTTTTIVNKQFLEEHEQAVIEYLEWAGMSVEWSLENMESAAALQEDLGTFMNNDVALDALPQISMVSLAGVTMRTAMAGFLEELYKVNPDSIGGSIPGDDFYYLPPQGSLADEYQTAGLARATGEASPSDDASNKA